MKFFTMLDRSGNLVAVSLENIRAIESSDRENESEVPYIRFTYTDGAVHCVELWGGKTARTIFNCAITILNDPKGAT